MQMILSHTNNITSTKDFVHLHDFAGRQGSISLFLYTAPQYKEADIGENLTSKPSLPSS